MLIHNRKNIRLIKQFTIHLSEDLGLSPQTITGAKRALKAYQQFTRYADFSSFSRQQIIDFKAYLLKRDLSKTTLLHYMNDLRRFFDWLSDEKGFKSKINKRDIQCLRLSRKDMQEVKAQPYHKYASLADYRKIITSMPYDTLIQKRDRAIIALLLLTGCRDGGLVSLRIDSFDKNQDLLTLDPRFTNSKNSKIIHSFLIKAVGSDIYQIFIDYYNALITEHDFKPQDPLFPKAQVKQGANDNFIADGLTKEFLTTANQIRAIFKQAFKIANLPYCHPHTIRKTLTDFAEKNCNTPEQFKAFSQNLGHSKVQTTAGYIKIDFNRQKTLIENMSKEKSLDPLNNYSLEELLQAVTRKAGMRM